MEILKIEDLSFTYPMCSTPAVKNVSFGVEKGEFVTVCGATGSGKSTLLRLFKREISCEGERTGRIYFKGKTIEEQDDRTSACTIGYVMQKPEQQIVCDKVWHELAFGLENMNVQRSVIARRVAEIAAYFGIESWYEKKVSELSGGQKQLLNLAAVMVMDPSILILDEPTAQLDPIAASDFIATIKKLNRELSLTVIIAEHRLEEIIPISDKLLVMTDGALAYYDIPRNVISSIKDMPELLRSMPASARLYHALDGSGECPLDIREGRAFVENSFKNDILRLPEKTYTHSSAAALELKDVYFRYERELADVLRGLSMTVYEGEIYCILGGNGSGKTTTLSVASALLKAYSGSVKVFGKKLKDYKNNSLYRECLSLLAQDVQTVFVENTVREELCSDTNDVPSLPYDISRLYDKHPYDLSGGEQQLVALAKVLGTKPKLLLLDEPTKGLDANAKYELVRIFKELKADGMTVVAVTHDVEFAALCADRCALFFAGSIVSEDTAERFFAENSFYTTAASRMTRGYYENAVTLEDAAKLCLENCRKDGALV